MLTQMFDIINGVKLCTWYKSRIILRLNMHDQISKYFRWKSILFMFLWGWFRNILKDKLKPHDVKAKCLFLKVTKYTFRNRPFPFHFDVMWFQFVFEERFRESPRSFHFPSDNPYSTKAVTRLVSRLPLRCRRTCQTKPKTLTKAKTSLKLYSR